MQFNAHAQVGNWLGSGRWALLDLSAAPSDWGPVLGGDGVVTKRGRLPSLERAFAPVEAAKRKARQARHVAAPFCCC